MRLRAYSFAWTKDEVYDGNIVEPSDKRMHILDSGGIRTLCKHQAYGKARDGSGSHEVCDLCRRKADNPDRRRMRTQGVNL